MTYFGGLGAGKGWNKFNFIISPDEFEALFNDLNYFFVITGSRVPVDYTFTDKDLLFKSYHDFFHKILIGQKTYTKNEKWSIERHIRTSITDDLSKIAFEGIDEKQPDARDFKLVVPTEPVINMSPFYLTLTGTGNLSMAFMNEEGIIGLELTYPKVVSWKSDGFNSVQETAAFSTNDLFLQLVKRIKAISHKAKVNSETKVFKPNFWITENAAHLINRNPYLMQHQLTVE